MQFNTTDLRILQVLQEGGHISNQDLVERAALSPSACLRRMRVLKGGGATTGYRAQLGRATLGLGLEVIVQVSMYQDVTDQHETFMAAVQNWPEIVAVYIITGDCNYILRVQAPNLRRYSEFVIERLYKTPDVMDIRSNIVLRTIKDRDGGLTLLMEAWGMRPLGGKTAGKGGRAKQEAAPDFLTRIDPLLEACADSGPVLSAGTGHGQEISAASCALRARLLGLRQVLLHRRPGLR